jgi:hypothetical protein
MTSTVGNNGRLGNQILRNLAVSLIAEKFNLKVTYFNKDLIHRLGIHLFTGTHTYNRIQNLTDDNYFAIYNADHLNSELNPNQSYFQTKEITNFLYNYLHKIKSTIIEKNPFQQRYNKNNDLFIHIRLGDVRDKNPGIRYYLKTMKTIQFDNLYISTDEKNHTIVKTLLKRYPNAKIITSDEITTFQYASTCKHIILSHGSFSAVIGYLSFFSSIYYPEYDLNNLWYGDMFSINNWIKMSYK